MKRITPLILISVIILTGCSEEKPAEVTRTVPIMGTFLEIRARGIKERTAVCVDETLLFAGTFEEKFSIFSTRSEINQLNLRKKAEVSPDLYEVLSMAKDIGSLTNGAFDVTVAPLMKRNGLYKDMPWSVFNTIPDEYIKNGWKNIELTPPGGVVLNKDVWIDLSGIAKGYVVDRMSDRLRSENINDFLINAGGDIYCGRKGTGGKWMIGLRGPSSKSALLVIAATDKAVATSGDYENWVVDEETLREISHIVNPLIPDVMVKELASMTVISSSCAYADALATAMMAMGKTKAMALADRLDDVELISVTTDNGECLVSYSDGAEEYVAMVGCAVEPGTGGK